MFCQECAGLSGKQIILGFVAARILLHGVAGAGIAWIDRLASGESFVLAVIIANAVFAQFPAKINLFVVNDGKEIQKADVQILDHASGFQNTVQRTFETFLRPSAARANFRVRSSTEIWLTTFPAPRFSSAHSKCTGVMRNMVVQTQTLGSRDIT